MGSRSVTRRHTRDPPAEGSDGTGADPRRRRPPVPPEAGPRFAVRCRVDGAAPATPPRDPRHRHHGGDGRSVRRRRARRRRSGGAGRRLPVLRGDPQPGVPPARCGRRLAAQAADGAAAPRPIARDDAGRGPRALPTGHAARPDDDGAALLRPLPRLAGVLITAIPAAILASILASLVGPSVLLARLRLVAGASLGGCRLH